MTSPGHPEPTAQELPTTADPAVDPSHAQPQTSGRSRRPHRRGGGAFLLKRLGTYLIVAVVSVLLNFILPRFMPGDPATQLIKDIVAKTGAPPSGYQMRLIKARYGDPDRSVLLQFWDYLVQLVHGDLGKSIEYYPVNVTTLINQALPWTLYLAIASTILGWIVGTWLGVRLGWKPGRKLDSIVTPLIDVLQLDPSLLARPAHRMVFRLQERLVPQPGRLRQRVDDEPDQRPLHRIGAHALGTSVLHPCHRRVRRLAVQHAQHDDHHRQRRIMSSSPAPRVCRPRAFAIATPRVTPSFPTSPDSLRASVAP